jgi:hypothetical protein
VKTKEKGPSEVVIKKEMFIVQDARPLYHFAEEDAPISSMEREYLRLKELKAKEEKEKLYRLQQVEQEEEDGEEASLEEGKSYAEGDDSVAGAENQQAADFNEENEEQANEKGSSIGE